MVGRATLARRAVQVEDAATDPELVATHAFSRAGNIHTVLAVPLLLKSAPIGVITLSRTRVAPFDDKLVTLVESFADQAVIAIENTRLFEAEQASKRELQESLEYQTAISDVLGVISRSPTDVQPVFDSIAQSAVRLCEGEFAFVLRFDGELLRFAASYGLTPQGLTALRNSLPRSAGNDTANGRAILQCAVVQIPDVQADAAYGALGVAEEATYRSLVAVPLLRDGDPIGGITVGRAHVGSFSDSQIALLKSLADQAVIAIENARLFEAEQASKRELQESLKYQTAISEVLSVISRSQTEIRPVFDAILESAVRLCDADQGGACKVENGMLLAINWYPDRPEIAAVFRDNFPRPVDRTSLIGQAVIEKKVLHVADIEAHDRTNISTTVSDRLGYRSQVSVPLLRNGQPIGVLALVRKAPEPFTAPQIAIATTFADQAVIAIENTRLFDEVQARTLELAKTVEDLEIASQHKNQFVANMSHELRTPLAAILGYAELIQEGFYGALPEKSLNALTRIRSNGKHLLGLINTVLDIAKIESGQFTLNMSEYAIESVVETVRAATESLAHNKKLTLTTSVDKPLPAGLGDEQRLTQVLLNLVGNAIKFTDSGEVRIAAGARNGHFAVSVTDTGPGIPLDQQDRIFEQFHQVDSSNTKAKGGTGLGLAIAKQIVEMHGGRIWVVSTPGKGSTFQMELPTRAQFHKKTP
jgi:signal transduction histidine kinase